MNVPDVSERRNRQQHVGVSHCRAEFAQHDDEIRLLERSARGHRVRTIELGLRMQQHVRAARLVAIGPEHRLRIHSIALRQCTCDVTSYAIGGFGTHTECRARDRGERLGKCDDLRCVAMLHRVVAEQNRAPLAR